MAITAETECGVPMARMPGAEMAAEMAAVPMMETRRPVVPVMAVMHHVVEVVPVKVVKVAARKSMTEAAKAAEMTAETMRRGARCRERDSKQTKNGSDERLQHRSRPGGTNRGIIRAPMGEFDPSDGETVEIVKR